eukprot:Skav203752  [mRNA]  locus=scaffold68:571433:572693:+ [translate_table: standard]
MAAWRHAKPSSLRRKAVSDRATEVMEPTRRKEMPTGQLQGDVFLVQPKHSVVLASLQDGGYAAFDFVPKAPEDPKAAVQLLLGAGDDGDIAFVQVV